jgi:hypothetical protein
MGAQAHHRPAGVELPAASAMIGSEPKRIDQAGKSRERELVEQHEADAQAATRMIPIEPGFRVRLH